jgi:hypothetical protein
MRNVATEESGEGGEGQAPRPGEMLRETLSMTEKYKKQYKSLS